MKHKLSYSFLHGFGWAVLLVISSIVYTLFEEIHWMWQILEALHPTEIIWSG